MMLWVAAENWPWLVLAALAGAGTTTLLTLHRAPADDEPAPQDEPA
jgi:hypothetical protein